MVEVFREYKTEEELVELNQEVLSVYNAIKSDMSKMNADNNLFKYPIQSHYSKKYLEALRKNKELGRNVIFPKVPYEYNRRHVDLFVPKIKECAKNDGLYIEVKEIYDEELKTWMYEILLVTSKYFEKTYGYPLEEFYSIQEENNKFKEYNLFKKELLSLKRRIEINKITYKDAYDKLCEINQKYNKMDNELLLIENMFIKDEENKIVKLKK